MSPVPFNRSQDLKRLREEGYFVQITGGFLVMREVPYVNEQRDVLTGTLISPLNMAGDQTLPPDTHVVHFVGEHPCDAEASPIQGIGLHSDTKDLGNGLVARYGFSSKPDDGYSDYYHKMTSYANILSGPAAVLRPGVSARVFREPEEEENSVFNYTETASDRVGIGALTEKLACETVAIVGLGGTGSYVLDQVAKTPVREIRLFDKDDFLQHNAFRSPGAPTLEVLREAPKKVEHLKGIYGNMHRRIVPHTVNLDVSNIDLLGGVSFAFLCMDAGEAKRAIMRKLEEIGAAFIDVGLGLELNSGSLGGILRVTASTPKKRQHVHCGRVPLSGGGQDDLYASNIQVADLNALNAVLAVLKWKKIRGFYRDLEREHHCTYTTDGNTLDNAEVACADCAT